MESYLVDDDKNNRLLKTRTNPTLLAVELATESGIAVICRVPAVPPVDPGLAAWKLKSLGFSDVTV